MHRVLAAVRTVAICVAVGALIGTPSAPATTRVPGLELAGGADSKEELIERLLAALASKDLLALHTLRVTESEYKAILAWAVPVGTAPRVLRPEVEDWAWQTLDTKSRHYEAHLIQTYGGRDYEVRAVTFKKGTGERAGYRSYRQLRLSLDDDGSDVALATGSIIEADGRYKFESFIRD